MTQNPTIADSLQKAIAARMRTLTAQMQEICSRCELRTQSALLADLEDLLQDTFTGLHASIADIQDLLDNGNREMLVQNSSRELRTLIQDYTHLSELYKHIIQGGAVRGVEDITGENPFKWTDAAGQVHTLSPVALYTYYRNTGQAETDAAAEVADYAAIYRHVDFFIAAATGWTGTAFEGYTFTPEELDAITPVGCSERIARSLQQANSTEIKIGTRTLLEDKRAKKDGSGEQVIKTMQNTADMLSRSIITADMNEDGQALIARPLLQALNEKKARTRKQIEEEAKQDTIAKDLQGDTLQEWIDRKASALTPSATYITQALRGAIVIGNLEKPIADGEEKATYRLTLREITQRTTGQDNPNNEQIRNTWQAFCFLSTQQVDFIEMRSVQGQKKRRGRKPKNYTPQQQYIDTTQPDTGQKIIYTPYKIRTNPVAATFVQPLNEGEDYSGSTEVFLDIHHILTDGRRTDTIEIDGRKAFIKRPVAHLHTLQQIYSYSSATEIRFFNTMISKSHINEDSLLTQVFDYDNRLKLCGDDKERRNLQKHKPRDREALRDMFIKAKAAGLIAWYSRQEKIDGQTGRKVYVWKWGRPEGSSRELK